MARIFAIFIFSSVASASPFNHIEFMRYTELKSSALSESDFRLPLKSSDEAAYYLGFDRFFGEDDDTGVFSGRMSTMPLPPSPILSLSFEM